LRIFSNYLTRGKLRLKTLTLSDYAVVLLLNCSCALLSAIHHTFLNNADLAFLLKSMLEYANFYNLLGFSLLFSYVVISPPPSEKITVGQICMIALLTFTLTLFLSFGVIEWEKTRLPRFWEAVTYLLRLLLSSFWAMFVLLYLKNRLTRPEFQQLKQQVSDSEDQRNRAEMELHLLQAQLEPHFFFNTLANLHSLIDIDTEKAKLLLEELTQYLRSSIPQFRQRYISLQDELNIIQRYLNIQQIRFGQRLTYQIDVDDGCLHHNVLPMSVLTLVENAIKHGIEKIQGVGHITISVSHNTKNLLIVVCDTAAQQAQTCRGTGLNNLSARLQTAYGHAASFSIHTEPEVQTLARLEIPFHG
jgi:sensor histidine kinase YesM